MTKHKQLHNLKNEMEKDESLPLKKGANKLVFGSGNTEADVLAVGEGPGRTEDFQGLPFVGQAGKLLDKFFLLAEIKRKDIFITNIVHHRPPDNRDPLPEEILAYGKYLDRIIEIINPKIIITLGRFSMAKFLPNVFISGVHGKKFNLTWKDKKIVVVPMYHPAASLRNGNILEAEKLDFLNLKSILSETLKEESDKLSLVASRQSDKMEVEQINLF